MSGNIEISQTHPGARALEPGQVVLVLTDILGPLEDGRVRIYDEARQQFLQSNGRFGDTAQLLEVESVYNDSTTGAASIVISDGLAASMDPNSVVTVEVPAARMKQKMYWPELLVGQGPPLPPQDGPNHLIETDAGAGTSGGSDPVEVKKDKVAPPPPSPPPTPPPPFGLMTIVLVLLAGLALGASAVWLAFPPGQSTTQPANQAQIDDLENELSAAQDRAAQAENELLSVQDRLDATQDDLEQTEADLAQARRSLADLEAQFGSGEQAAMQRIEDAEVARDQAQRDLEAAQQDAQQAQAGAQAAQDRADAAEAAARQLARDKDQRLAEAERALEAERQRVAAAESAAAAAEAETRLLRDRHGSTETARVRDAEERARQAQIAAEQAKRRVNDLQGQLAAANRSSQTAQAATDRAVEERDRAIARAEEVERELARLQTASPPTPTFPMDAQHRACDDGGVFAPVIAYRNATTSGRFVPNQHSSLRALMCERDVPCPEAFKQVLGQDYADNAGVVALICRF